MLMLVTLILLLTTAGAASAQTVTDQKLGPAIFNVFVGSTLAGIERVNLDRSASGWIITSRIQVDWSGKFYIILPGKLPGNLTMI